MTPRRRRTSLRAAALLALLATAGLGAQSTAALPAGREAVAADAALSLPLRWSQGTLQTSYERPWLDRAGLAGRSLRALRLRRPVFVDEPAYPARTRRLEVTVAWTPRKAKELLPDTAANLKLAKTTQVAFAAADINLPATQPPGRADAVGATAVRLPLTTPVAIPKDAVVGAEHLLLQWRTLGSTLQVEPGHWVEALWFPGGRGAGRAHPVGGHGCGSAKVARPMRMVEVDGTLPSWGGKKAFFVADTRPDAQAWLLLGLDPTARKAAFDAVAFGGDLTALGLPGCHGWTPWDVILDKGRTASYGGLNLTVDVPDLPVLRGHRLGVQVAVHEPALNPLGLALSNGWVLAPDPLPGTDEVASVLVLGPGKDSEWLAFLGAAPVVLAEL